MVDEYQDTNRPQYLLIRRLAEAHRNLAVVGDPDQSIYKWRGADLRNILDFEHDFGEAHIVRLEQNYRSTQIILDAASAVISQNRNRKDKHLWTDRKGGARIRYYRGNDELEEADFIVRTVKQARAEDVEAMVAVLYRTNSQSRAIEDALMREGVPYKIIGGVRFYERKEIKDALAYMKLVINPHDDVSLRRVINVPARGIGKGVMDTLQAVDPDAVFADAPPLIAAGLQEISSARSLWAKLVYVVDEGKVTAARRDGAALVPRHAGRARHDRAAGLGVDRPSARSSTRSGYLADLRDENTEEANERIENLMELVSAAREYETRDAEASLGGFVDRLSLLSEADEESGTREARVWLMTMHAAKGLEFPTVIIAGLEEGLVPALAVRGERRGARGGAAPLLRRASPAPQSQPGADQRRTPPRVRRVSVDRAVAVPRRDPGGAGRADRAGLRVVPPGRLQPQPLRVPDQPVRPEGPRPGARGGSRPTPTSPRTRRPATFAPACACGIAQFGVGNVIAVEEHNDDFKVTVRFNSVGVKKLLAEVRQARAGVERRPSSGRGSPVRPADPSAPALSGRPASRRGRLRLPRSRRLGASAQLAPRRPRRPAPRPSFSASRATETTRSPSSMPISRTPCVARPIARMPLVTIRRILPCWLISISSSSPWT